RDAIDLCHRHGALFILDEMITGYKTGLPGSIAKYGIEPDLATWGKGIANGFSFCCLTGKREVMEIGGIKNKGEEKLFLISTTHGGETHAIAAALATMDVFQGEPVLLHNQAIGALLIREVEGAIQRKGLSSFVSVADCPWMTIFSFRDRQGNPCAGLRTLMMQEMIQRGILFQGSFVPCFSHTEEDVALFVQAFEEALAIYEQALERGYEQYLVGEPAKAVFRKYL
ncbi:MAG TPA: aminotransferase class III-fold pyridoxal phosphate-dependent enzyme, partial [Chroococcales cyanobacterium]